MMSDNINSKNLNIYSPWVCYAKEIEALFGEDPDIKIVYDNDNLVLKLYVNGDTKANAIEKLLPSEQAFGDVILKINIIPSNEFLNTRAGIIEAAFKGNPAYLYQKTVTGAFTNPVTYVVFKNKVVQYGIDSLKDINGLRSTLYQDIATELVGEEEGVFFCTEKE